MKRYVAGLFVFGAAILCGTAGQDDPKDKKRDPDLLFKKLDTNMDGVLSKEEFLKLAEFGKDKAKAREFLGRTYDKVATDKKGLTLDQFKKLYSELRKRKKDSEGSKGAGSR